jgi:hypothetical protein
MEHGLPFSSPPPRSREGGVQQEYLATEHGKSCPLLSLPSPELPRAFSLNPFPSDIRLENSPQERLPRITCRNADYIGTSGVK